MELTGEQIIGSEYCRSGEQGFNAMNPATGSALDPQFCEASLHDVNRAACLAEAALVPYGKKTLSERAAFLECVGAELVALAPDLIARAHEETALPLLRLEGELTRTVNQLKLFAKHVRQGTYLEARIDRAMPGRAPLPKPDLRAMQVPLGPVAVFGASNFPLAFSVAGGDTASALAAGCPTVVKGHPAHPGTSELAGLAVMRAVQKSHVPTGVFSLLQAKSTDLGAALVQHPQIRAVAFTGSLAGGRAVFDLASRRPEPIPVYAEMGSANPVFFLPRKIDGEGASLATMLTESMTLGVGQFCTAPGLLVVLESRATNEFISAIGTCLASKSPGVMLHDGIKQNYLHRLEKLLSVKGVEGVIVPSIGLDGCLVVPSLLKTDAKTFIDNPELSEEIFGPSAIVVVCDSKTEMLAVAESLCGQLTASVHGAGGELGTFRDLLHILERKAGRLLINNFPTGVEVCASMQHGGPYPASTDSRTTSVGTDAVKRFLRPVCYQNFPQELLPEPLRDRNEQHLWRLVDGHLNRDDL